MKRIVVITVGKTHSGKSTFAKALEERLNNSVIIDQDNHAAFINTHYKALYPKQGSNTIKFKITSTIVNYAIEQTDLHLIICSSNRYRTARLNMLSHFQDAGFVTILVHFCIDDEVIRARIAKSQRNTNIFRSVNSFEEVFARQQTEEGQNDVIAPSAEEADHYFKTGCDDEAQTVIKQIIEIAATTQL